MLVAATKSEDTNPISIKWKERELERESIELILMVIKRTISTHIRKFISDIRILELLMSIAKSNAD